MKILEVVGLTAHVGSTQLLDALSFTLEEGQILALCGPPGAGKTACLRCLGGSLAAESGRLIFDGRVTEDFKLDSGTWVSVGTLRPDIVAACAPLVFDAVICGQDKKFIGALLWPSPAAMKAATEAAGGDVAKAFGWLTQQVAEKLKAFNATQPGSSRRVGRFRMLTTPPSLDAITVTREVTRSSVMPR
jgi:ABC-type branched-subunit amino acid transport system ATPase component